MTTLYIIRKYGTEIYTVKAEKITDKMYTYLWNGETRRSALKNDYEIAYPSWEEAHGAILERTQKSIDAPRKDLIRLERMLGEVQAMTKPTEVTR